VPPVYVNGRLVDESDATISVFDHGLVVGDGVFETILLNNGAPFALRRHLDRMKRSAAGLGIAMPERSVVDGAVLDTVAASGWAEGRIRVTVTAGRGPLGSGRDDSEPTLVVAIGEIGEQLARSAVAVVPYRRNEHGALAGLKTTSYGENALALARAHEVDADEAIFANTAGLLCEGTGSNVFVVVDGELLTPPLNSGCLAGITRGLVLEAGCGREADLKIGDFNAARVEEAFLTSAIRGVQAIGSIDGRVLESIEGPHTQKAAAAYAHLLAEVPEP
jgi:branched-chain amino acid aminotransferase